jgi:hypothetical protein
MHAQQELLDCALLQAHTFIACGPALNGATTTLTSKQGTIKRERDGGRPMDQGLCQVPHGQTIQATREPRQIPLNA